MGTTNRRAMQKVGTNMQNEPQDLFTGMFTFPSPDQPDKKQFGMVGCTADPDGSNGLAIILLRLQESGIAYENVGLI